MSARLVDLDDATYFARPELSYSGLKTLLRPGGAARFKYGLTHPRPDKAEFDFGHALHSLLTGKGTPIAVIPDDVLAKNGSTNTAEAKAFIAAARERGDVPMKSDAHAKAQDMAAAIVDNPAAYALVAHPKARAEVSIIEANIDGVPMRGKVDFLLPEAIVDYKTAMTAAPEQFARDAFKWAYDVQAVVYGELIRQATGKTLPFLFVVQEKTPPYLASVVRLSDEYQQIGVERVNKALETYRKCTKAGMWPGYPAVEVEVDPPAYAYEDPEIEIPED